uniref:G_PROTEIN_RECEP_F1_2 domain-containing protein n=1 Tax=Steinernema glaseri TaxID=37863 RepID=A0A1I8AA76_9BILA
MSALGPPSPCLFSELRLASDSSVTTLPVILLLLVALAEPWSYRSTTTRSTCSTGGSSVLCNLIAAILHILVLVYPEWIGDIHGASFGLYNYCIDDDCEWSPFEVKQLSTAFSLSLFLVFSSTVLNVLAVFSILLLILLRDRNVLLACSWMHLCSFFAMLGGCLVFPAGWDHSRVREVCDSDRYRLSLCGIKWAYATAFVLVVDEFALFTLGFILASKRPPSIPEIHVDYDLPLATEKKARNHPSEEKQKHRTTSESRENKRDYRHSIKSRSDYLI